MPAETKSHRILRFILYLSNSNPKTREECCQFLEIKDSAFYNYCNVLRDTGFDLVQEEGKYRIDFPDEGHAVLRNILHFSEEENYLLVKIIDALDTDSASSARLRNKLVSFLNRDKAVEEYLIREKKEKALTLGEAIRNRKQALLRNYSSGNSQTVSDRLVEPFRFCDDFNLVWAFDTGLKENRQFKTSRIAEVDVTSLPWEHQRQHRAMDTDIFRNTGALDKEVVIEMDLRARNLLIEEYPLSEKYLEEKPQHRYILRVAVAKYEGPGRFCLGLSEDVEVRGDEGFGEYLKQKMNHKKPRKSS
jgi:predicted DNA-binding transcriptional regulator YafY